MWLFFIGAGGVTAMVTAALVQPLKGRTRKMLTFLIPGLALALYIMLGRPDLPGHPAGNGAETQARNDALLAQKPLRILKEQNPNDVGALAALGDLSLRTGHDKEAAAFYASAVKAAKAQHDPRLPFVREKLEKIKP